MDTCEYKKERYDEITAEMALMLTQVGWKKEFVAGSVPMIPISGWHGDNLIRHSDKMPWWNGVDVNVAEGPNKGTVNVKTLLDALDKMVYVPQRGVDAVMRTPISGVYKIKGTGTVLTGRVEQGKVTLGKLVSTYHTF